MPNGPQANPQQFQNKLAYNFANNAAGYDDQTKDYNNYNPQTQIKSSSMCFLFSLSYNSKLNI